jgi:hypothetical protein
VPKKINDIPSVGTILHQWTLNEYEQHDRTPFWYVFMLSIGLLLVVFGLFTGNFLFALIIILFAIVLFFQSQQSAIEVLFTITDLGVVISNRFYSYSEIGEFFIIYQPPQVKTLYLNTASIWVPKLRIPLYDQNPVEIRHTLQAYLIENIEKEDEPISDRLARNWGIH